MKTQTTTKPVQIIDGFIPVACVKDYRIDEALFSDVCDCHGSHRTLSNGRHLVLVNNGRLPGAWMVEYDYSEQDGIVIERVYVAAKL